MGFFFCRDGGAPVGGCGLCGSPPPVTNEAVLVLVPLAGRRPLVFFSNRLCGVMSRSLPRDRCGVLFRLLALLLRGDG